MIMNKLKKILKNYGVWLLIGILFGLIILLFFLSRRDDKQDGSDILVRKITSPYIQTGQDIKITGDMRYKEFENRELIYYVIKPEITLFSDLVNNLYGNHNEEIDSTEEEIILTIGEDLIWYNRSTAVLSVFSKGLILNPKITDSNDIESFFNHHFGIREITNEQIENTERGVLYTGNFLFHGKAIGSSTLMGYGYKIELDRNGRLLDFSMLLLREENLQQYQRMPTVSLTQLLTFKDYPMKTVNKTIEDRFYDQSSLFRRSVNLKNLITREVSSLFLFHSFQDEYILPIYRIFGDGELVDSAGGKYWSTSYAFVCAIDPEYLYEKPEEDYAVEPHSRPLSENDW